MIYSSISVLVNPVLPIWSFSSFIYNLSKLLEGITFSWIIHNLNDLYNKVIENSLECNNTKVNILKKINVSFIVHFCLGKYSVSLFLNTPHIFTTWQASIQQRTCLFIEHVAFFYLWVKTTLYCACWLLFIDYLVSVGQCWISDNLTSTASVH